MQKEITGEEFGKFRLFTEPGEGIQVAMQDILKIFSGAEGYETNLNRLRRGSDIHVVETETGELVEVITLINLIESVVSTPGADRMNLYDMIGAIEDAVVTC